MSEQIFYAIQLEDGRFWDVLHKYAIFDLVAYRNKIILEQVLRQQAEVWADLETAQIIEFIPRPSA